MKTDLQFDEATNLVKRFYLNFPRGEMPIWNLENRGRVFKIFSSNGKSEINLDAVIKKITLFSEVRREAFSSNAQLNFPVKGKILAFYPGLTMHDGLSEKFSHGFFDFDDVPPPEFWLLFRDNTLFSFIPDEFIGRANSGIESSLGDSLEWATIKTYHT